MTRIESDKALIDKEQKNIFDFLSDFNNFGKLMPEQVTNWQSNADECSFTISGMANLGMKIAEKRPSDYIRVVKNGEAPFDFTMECLMKESAPGKTEVQLALEANLNPMMKMMVAKPLTNFLNMLVEKLKELPENS